MKHAAMKDEKKRAFPKFLLLILVSGLIGGVLGFFLELSRSQGLPDAISGTIQRLMPAAARWGIPVTLLVLYLPALLIYFRCKSKYTSWDGEDEDLAEQIEQSLSWGLLLSGLAMILSLFFLGAGLVYLVGQPIQLIVNAGALLLSLLLVTVLQQKIVELTKMMNPEKRGSVYDLNFKKKWMDSCDEAEQKQIGQAAYHAFQFTSNFCAALYVLLFFSHIMFETGILPIFLVLLIWGVMLTSYTLECMRLSKRHPLP